MTTPSLNFHLAADRGAARRLRRILAQSGGGFGVAVGSWPDLLERARDAYLLPAPAEDWESRLREALPRVDDAFWLASLRAAPEETAVTVAAALKAVLTGLGPTVSTVAPSQVSNERAARHLSDLLRLYAAMDHVLPPDLAVMGAILSAPPPLRRLAVRVEGAHHPSRWQKAVLDRLTADAGREPPPSINPAPMPSEVIALVHLQRGLYELNPGPKVLWDKSLQWLGLRDIWEAADVAAGMAQRALGDGLTPAEVGLLVPNSPLAHAALAAAFQRGGLPLAHLGRPEAVRDLGREVVSLFLRCQRRPAPQMAVAALVTSPLMPWPRATGNDLAQVVMKSGVRSLRLPENAPESWQSLERLLQAKEPENGAKLAGRLRVFLGNLRADGSLTEHHGRAKASVETLSAALAGQSDIDWATLFRLSRPAALERPGSAEAWLEGVTLLDADLEPWRPVRRLIVLDFNAGLWPVPPAASPVFATGELDSLRAAGLDMDTPEAVLTRRRALFRRQLGAAREHVTFLVCRRDGLGNALEPSDSLIFMHSLLAGGPEKPEELILDLDAPAERALAQHLPLADEVPAVPQRALGVGDLDLGRDLTRANGPDAPLRSFSPSSLETLVVSPLAWLLQKTGAEPTLWEREVLDPARKGTVAHRVFEVLFPRDTAPLSAIDVNERLPQAFDEAVAREVPFLDMPEWTVERRHLRGEILEAAQTWRAFLKATGAQVVETEVWLTGEFDDIPLRGAADVVLQLPSGQLVVVDYKKSKGTDRRDRMSKGWDSQAHLYRLMLKTGGPSEAESAARLLPLAGEDVAVLYFTMNDGACLTDRADWFPTGLSALQGTHGDVAGAVVACIRGRLADLRAGRITLNRTGDAERLKKDASIKGYALEKSPLIALFTLPDAAALEENEEIPA